MSVINTNVNAIVAQNSLVSNNRNLSKTMEQLSTGSRINSAADDAAGLAISNKMTAQIRGLNQSVRNANDAISMLQTAEGAMTEVTNMMQRMRELAVQTANGTNTTADKAAIQAEFAEMQAEIKRISNNTEWNGRAILTGSANGTGPGVTFQVGANAAQTISITLNDLSAVAGVAPVLAASTTFSAATATAITNIDTAIAAVDTYRSTIGSTINRLNYAADNLANIATNTAASRSRILDTDYAKATSELARTQIIQQAATAMLAQANQQPASVLSLLQ
jgi:flagellin